MCYNPSGREKVWTHSNRAVLLALLAICWLSRPSNDLWAQPEPGVDEFLVKFKSDWDIPGAAIRWMDTHGLTVISYIPRINVWVVALPDGPSALGDWVRDGAIAWAEPNGVVRMSSRIPNDYWYNSQQGHLVLMGLPDAWAITTGDAQPIAIIDTGVDLDHPDLSAKLWINPNEVAGNGVDDDGNGYVDDVHGWNFVGSNSQPQDDQGHGSHVAGIAAAGTNNGIGIAGMSWQATIMPIKVLNNAGNGTFANLAAGIIYAVDNGTRVINLSLGGTTTSTTVAESVSYAQNHGCLVLAAAGNSGISAIEFPASLPGVIAVGATTADDERWSNSNFGPELSVTAPGENITSANAAGSYVQQSGTSMSTAHASGLAALVWSVRPDFTAVQIARLITETAHDIASPGWDPYTGWGRLDAHRAVRAAAMTRWFLPIVLRP